MEPENWAIVVTMPLLKYEERNTNKMQQLDVYY
jgi:hypothetical protein